jgi:hypothetical protein
MRTEVLVLRTHEPVHIWVGVVPLRRAGIVESGELKVNIRNTRGSQDSLEPFVRRPLIRLNVSQMMQQNGDGGELLATPQISRTW